jgi:hypothetical protein
MPCEKAYGQREKGGDLADLLDNLLHFGMNNCKGKSGRNSE